MHCVGGHGGTSSAKERFGEVSVQHQEASPAVLSTDLTSGQLKFWVKVW